MIDAKDYDAKNERLEIWTQDGSVMVKVGDAEPVIVLTPEGARQLAMHLNVNAASLERPGK